MKLAFLIPAALVAHNAFGTPPLAGKQVPDSTYQEQSSVSQSSASIYARLSMLSQQVITKLQNQIIRDNALPANCVFSEEFIVQTMAKHGKELSRDPAHVVSTLDGRIKGLEAYSWNDLLKGKTTPLRMERAVVLAFLAMPIEQQKLILGEPAISGEKKAASEFFPVK